MIMQEDPAEMVRYFSDFLTEISLIIANIKCTVYEIIDVQLSTQRVRSVMHSMSSVILATHKTFDDLKKVESILSGVVKSKRIVSCHHSSQSFKKRSKTAHSRLELFPPKEARTEKEKQIQERAAANEVRTVKRGTLSKTEIKQQLERSASSDEEALQKTLDKNNSKLSNNKTIKHAIERGMQHSNSEVIVPTNRNGEQRIHGIIKSNQASLEKIMQTNTECLRLVRSARKGLKSKRK